MLDTVPRSVRMLAESLSRLHGPAIIRNESNGYHIYIASPECIKQDGRKEIQSKHLTVNASKYRELPEWKAKHKGNHDPDFSAVCHKTDTRYRVSDLLNEKKFPPLEKRGIPNITSQVICASVQRQECLVQDAAGNMVPQDPGEVIPLSDLPSNHPAIEYIVNRGYNPVSLESQFNCGFCSAEAPENSTKGIFYKKLPAGFKDTPQGRIIFFAMINGVQVGWQARILERVTASGIKEYWHPYKECWTPIETKNTATGKWECLPGIEDTNRIGAPLWKPSKYKTAFGMLRNESLIGIDAAVDFNKKMNLKKSTAFIVEGPLDAGRLGPGGVAILGKYLSDRQADMLIRKFRRLIMLMDNDKAGKEAKERIIEVMKGKMVDISFVEVPSGYKDIGEMDTISAMTLAYKYI